MIWLGVALPFFHFEKDHGLRCSLQKAVEDVDCLWGCVFSKSYCRPFYFNLHFFPFSETTPFKDI